MSEHLLKAGANITPREGDELARLPYLRTWFRTRSAIILHLSNGCVQINFFQVSWALEGWGGVSVPLCWPMELGGEWGAWMHPWQQQKQMKCVPLLPTDPSSLSSCQHTVAAGFSITNNPLCPSSRPLPHRTTPNSSCAH